MLVTLKNRKSYCLSQFQYDQLLVVRFAVQSHADFCVIEATFSQELSELSAELLSNLTAVTLTHPQGLNLDALLRLHFLSRSANQVFTFQIDAATSIPQPLACALEIYEPGLPPLQIVSIRNQTLAEDVSRAAYFTLGPHMTGKGDGQRAIEAALQEFHQYIRSAGGVAGFVLSLIRYLLLVPLIICVYPLSILLLVRTGVYSLGA